MAFVGLDGVAEINTGTLLSPTWLECDTIKDLNLGLTGDMAETSSRASGAWKWNLPSLRDFAPEFDVVYERSDTAQALLLAAFLARTSVDMRFLDGPSGSGGTGFRAQFYVSEFGNGQQLVEGMSVSVKLALAHGSTPTAV